MSHNTFGDNGKELVCHIIQYFVAYSFERVVNRVCPGDSDKSSGSDQLPVFHASKTRSHRCEMA